MKAKKATTPKSSPRAGRGRGRPRKQSPMAAAAAAAAAAPKETTPTAATAADMAQEAAKVEETVVVAADMAQDESRVELVTATPEAEKNTEKNMEEVMLTLGPELVPVVEEDKREAQDEEAKEHERLDIADAGNTKEEEAKEQERLDIADTGNTKEEEVKEQERLDMSDAGNMKEEEVKEQERLDIADAGNMKEDEEGLGPEPEEGVEEPLDGESMAKEAEEGGGGGEGEEAAEGQGEEESTQVEEDERMVISDMAEKRKLKKEQEIFIGGLDRDAVEEDIKKAFEQVGEVVEVRLHKDFVTNKNKGFAFVKFASKEQVTRALLEMKNPMIRGKRCGIAASEDNDTLFLGNICNTWTKEAVKQKLQEYGIDGVENITLVPDTQNEGLSRGFAFLEFSCHVDAMLAFKRLQKPDVVFGHPERTAKVAFAEPLREPHPEVMAQVKSVFVDGLPPYWDEERVKEQFKGYGDIERVVLARNMSTAKRNDFGFVNFTSHEAALACIEGINNTEFGDDGKSKIKARARLANPLPKTQAVKGGMSGGFRIGYSGGGFNRFGRGFGRGRPFPHRAGFQGGRGFNMHARGRSGRFNFSADNAFEASSSDFRGRRPFGFRGGRWQPSASGRHGGFDRGHGRGLPSRRPPFVPEGDFGRQFGEDPYFYEDVGHGVKRPFSMMEHDPGYFQPGPRLRPRFDYDDPLSGGSRYRESYGMGGLYSRDYLGPDYGSSTYSSLYRGGNHPGGGYYY